jgi:hypothetical protein
MAQSLAHPRVLATSDGGLPNAMKVPFYLMILAMALLFVTLSQYEMASKNAKANLRALRRHLGGDDEPYKRSAAPSLPSEGV